MGPLVEEAARMGISVHLAELQGDERGFYSRARNIIVVRLGLTLAQTREALAHELGHAFYSHECSTPLAERQADRRAALLLVDPDEYAAAEQINAHENYVARELGLTAHIVKVWREWWLPQLVAAGWGTVA